MIDASQPDRASAESRPVRHNVPRALSTFVGRTAEAADLLEVISWCRMTSVVGPGGSGKTRLVREVAEEFVRRIEQGDLSRFPDGVAWVDLAPVTNGSDVVDALAAVLEVRTSTNQSLTAAIAESLRTRGVLVVLDNCEHLIQDAAVLADSLLRAAPHITIVATSREALSVEGERVWTVPRLSQWLPDEPSDDITAEQALTFDSIALFAQRTKLVFPSFALTDSNAATVAGICSRLDGLPLAIELAAAVTPVLGIDGLASRLDDALTILSRGKRSSQPRHQTMRAVLDWSFQLLSPEEQSLLCRLSVFRGAFTIEDAAEVCGFPVGQPRSEHSVLQCVTRLVHLSLVEPAQDYETVSFRLLETVRQYGASKLGALLVERETRLRHAQWVAGFAERLEPLTFGPERGQTVLKLRRSVEEIRYALYWAIAPHGDSTVATRIAGALGWYWISMHPWEEARHLIDAALNAADAEGVVDSSRPPSHRLALGKMMYPLLGIAYFLGDVGRTLAIAPRALSLWRSVDSAPESGAAELLASARGTALCCQLIGLAHAMRGESRQAITMLNRSVATAERSGDKWLWAVMLMRRALGHFILGDHTRAHHDFDASVPTLRALGDDWFLSLALEGMASNSMAVGDLKAAAAHAVDSVLVLRAEPDRWFMSRSLDTIAAILDSSCKREGTFTSVDRAAMSRSETAACLMGAASAMRRRCGAGVIGPDKDRYAELTRSLIQRLGEKGFHAAFMSGEPLSVNELFDKVAHDADIASVVRGDSRQLSIGIGNGDGLVRSVSVRALGAVSIAVGDDTGSSVVQPAGKVFELLLFLLLHDGASKNEIGAALWPEASAEQVRNLFHVTLHSLRKSLGSAIWIKHERGTYRFDRSPHVKSGFSFDVESLLDASSTMQGISEVPDATNEARYQLSREALFRLGGRLARGLDAGDWILAHQDRVQGAWAEGMTAAARFEMRCGKYEDAAHTLELLIQAEPLRESAHRLYMETLSACGEASRALAHYDRLKRTLRAELGAEPAKETRLLAERMRAWAVSR